MMNISINIPEKSNFSLIETCSIVDIKGYVLRFWESEFSELSPTLSSSGQKLFRYEDVEILFYIKELLFNNKLTIDQAKPELKQILIDNISNNTKNGEDIIIPDSVSEVNLKESSQKQSISTPDSDESVIKNNNIDELKSMLTGLTSRLTEIQSANNWI